MLSEVSYKKTEKTLERKVLAKKTKTKTKNGKNSLINCKSSDAPKKKVKQRAPPHTQTHTLTLTRSNNVAAEFNGC